MKKNYRLVINIISLGIILLVALGIYNLAIESIKEENNIQNISATSLSDISEEKSQPESKKIQKSKEVIYDSEQYTDYIVNDIASSEKEINFSPKVAFIIDDLGYETNVAEKIIELDFPVTLSILPFLQYSEYIAEEGKKKNREIMLHLPMESNNSSVNPGPGAIRSYMPEEDIRQMVRDSIDSVPYISGMNNHMGSKITEDEKIMKIILGEIKEINLFFIDSRTSKNSIAYEIAQEMGIKTAKRSVFLDNENDMDYIKGQILEVQEIALREGEAIAIGHDRINTYYVLKRMVPELIGAGIEVVSVSELIK